MYGVITPSNCYLRLLFTQKLLLGIYGKDQVQQENPPYIGDSHDIVHPDE